MHPGCKSYSKVGLPVGRVPDQDGVTARRRRAATSTLGRGSLAAALQSAKTSEEEVDWRAEGRAAAGNADLEPNAPPSRFERMKVSWASMHVADCCTGTEAR